MPSAARRRVAVLLALAGLLTIPSSTFAAPAVTVKLSAAKKSVPQGTPFTFSALVVNRGSAAAKVDLSFLIRGSGGIVPFYRKDTIVPGHGRVKISSKVTPSQWFAEQGTYQIGATDGGKLAGNRLSFRVSEPLVLVPTFADVSGDVGIETTVPPSGCAQFSNGAAWGDIDGDGSLDLYLTRLDEPAQLFVSDGRGHFSQQAAARGVAARGAVGAVFADYDNDGDQDLYVTVYGPDRLYRNDGGGRFADVASSAGIVETLAGSSAGWGDYDDDGRLDLYVANYFRCVGERTFPAPITDVVQYHPDRLYHNEGDGTFRDVTSMLEGDPSSYADSSTYGAGFLGAWLDYNGDGRSDLYLANDFFGPKPDHNRLWRNDGSSAGGAWRFTDVSVASGTALSMNTMGIGVGDYDRDLRLDLALSNIRANRLLRNMGNGKFVDVARPVGVARPDQRADQVSVTWGTASYDFNLDGWEDLYFAAGNIVVGYDENGVQRNALFVNSGRGRFLDLSAPSGADDPGDSKGVAFADYDRDGRMDLFVVNQGGAPLLYQNVTPKEHRHWLGIDVVGTVSSRDACGARLVLTVGKASMLREVSCGSTSVSSGSQTAVLFGLGTATQVDRLVVTWPRGARQVLRNLQIDSYMTLTEPKV